MKEKIPLSGDKSTAWDIRVEEVFVEDELAAIDETLDVFAVVNEEEKERQRAAEILPVFNVEVGTAVDVEFGSEFHLGEVLVNAGFVETVTEVGTEFAEAGIIFGKSHGVCSSLSLKIQ